MTKAEPYAQRLIAEEEVKAKHSLLGALVFSGIYLKVAKNGYKTPNFLKPLHYKKRQIFFDIDKMAVLFSAA